jgi:ribonuclease PH
MALIDAGIAIRYIITSVNIAVLENNEIILDPTTRQLNRNTEWKGIQLDSLKKQL